MKKWDITPVPTWEFSDEFWKHIEPILTHPRREEGKKYRRKSWWWRPSLDFRKVFAGILFVLRTGIQWKALPKDIFWAPSSVHRYFTLWLNAWVFYTLWQKWLVEYDEMKGIAWEWQSADGSMWKSPMWKEDVGKNPTDRGKKWNQKKSSCRRIWNPLVSRRVLSK
jgi:transposase